ncbi:DUF2334 domain-containing protein [Opitutaceae bacterium TAV4]|nr:DUF2334 domain-containing protein [Opitutaceae bacterium TAV4]RRK00959.1 DUF2334 domain-containing protein [Opitutaceae bacterium TAV3]
MTNIRFLPVLFISIVATTIGFAETSARPARSSDTPVFDASTLPDPLPAIVLKLDDLTTRKDIVPPAWKRLTDFALERKIKISIGVIANSLEGDKPAYFNYIKELQKTGLIEFWFHGYDHRMWEEGGVKLQEFKGTSYEHQKEHFEKSQKLAREKLGFAFTIFGSPFNGFDPATMRVLSEDSDIQIFLYGNPRDTSSGKIILDRVFGVNIEDPTFVPNPEKFISGYIGKAKGRRFYVIQGHPGSWKDERWDNFVRIVDFLQKHRIPILTPSELVEVFSITGR